MNTLKEENMSSDNNSMSQNKFVTYGKTKLVKGSILSPELGNLRLVFVPCSISGKPDGELYSLLSKKWKSAKAELKGWYAQNVDFKLGSTYTTAVQSDVWLLHSLCYDKNNKLDEKALLSCVKKIATMAKYEKASVHISMLAASAIPQITPMIEKEMIEKGITAYFYEEATEELV